MQDAGSSSRSRGKIEFDALLTEEKGAGTPAPPPRMAVSHTRSRVNNLDALPTRSPIAPCVGSSMTLAGILAHALAPSTSSSTAAQQQQRQHQRQHQQPQPTSRPSFVWHAPTPSIVVHNSYASRGLERFTRLRVAATYHAATLNEALRQRKAAQAGASTPKRRSKRRSRRTSV